MARQASEAVQSAQEDADTRIAEAQQRAQAELDRFRSDYPVQLTFPYKLDKKASERPFLVEAMWHDGRFTLSAQSGPGSAGALRTLGRPSQPGGLRSDPGRPLYRTACTERRVASDRQKESALAL